MGSSCWSGNSSAFLLTKKRSVFLLRMCDRLADLDARFHRVGSSARLFRRSRLLSRRIAVDSPGPARSEPVQASATGGPTAAQVRPCEVCAAASSALWEFQRRFQYEITINPAAQRDLAAHGGLCSFHNWQYEANSSPQGISEGYPAVLEDWATWMRCAASDARHARRRGEVGRAIAQRDELRSLPRARESGVRGDCRLVAPIDR